MTSQLVPILQTDRLIMRGPGRADFKDCVEMWSSPATTQFIGGRAFTSEEVWSRMLRYTGHWALLGFGYWLVCEKVSQAFVGEVGFANFERDLTPSLGDAPEAGWAVTPRARGRGYAREASAAAQAWIDDVYGARRTVCLIDRDNAVSQGIAARCGYQVWSEARYHDAQVLLLERTAPAPSPQVDSL